MRAPERRYADPLDELWLGVAARLGLRVVRSTEVYASTDGRGTLVIGAAETLDADDCLAQMILHELCHALVQAPAGLTQVDWGLCNEGSRDLVREHACLRLQAALLAPLGLRRVLAPTTEHRAFYDALGVDPLAPRYDEAAVLARLALARAAKSPFAPHLADALQATAVIVVAAARFAAPADGARLPALLAAVEEPPARHSTGLLRGPTGTCGECAWQRPAGPGRKVLRCRHAADARVDASWPACERFEPALDCQTCGACCRAAYHSVEVGPRDPVIRRHPALVVARDGYRELLRSGDRCAALGGGGDERYVCAIYDDRPRTCRDFTRGGGHCLDARRRVGLSS